MLFCTDLERASSKEGWTGACKANGGTTAVLKKLKWRERYDALVMRGHMSKKSVNDDTNGKTDVERLGLSSTAGRDVKNRKQ